MEQALFVSCIEDLRHAYTRRFDWIYFGNEVCHWLMPTGQQLRSALSFARLQGLPLTFVTPVLPEGGLERVRALLPLLPPASEVVVNDFGLVTEIVASGHQPLLGRVLLKVKRDPRISAEDLEDEGLARHLRSSNISNPSFQEVLHQLGIRRVELDNVQQGYDLDLPARLSTSLYGPFVSAAITRRCGLNFTEGNQDNLWQTGACREHCQTTQLEVSTIKHKGDQKVWASYRSQGASHFFVNERPPENTEGWNLDRQVFLPRPPVFASLPADPLTEAWDEAYRESGHSVPWNHDEADSILMELAGRASRSSPAPKRALELGCGTGRNLEGLRGLGYEALGIERSPAALDLLAGRYPLVSAVFGDVLEYPLEKEAFALVADYGCLHALPPTHRTRYGAQVQRTVAPGGHYLLCSRTRPEEHPAEEPIFLVDGALPEWGFSEAQVAALLGPSFRLEEVVPHEGETHPPDPDRPELPAVVERFAYYLFRKMT